MHETGAQLQPQHDGASPGTHSSQARALLLQTPKLGVGQYGAALARLAPASVSLGVQRPEREKKGLKWPLYSLLGKADPHPHSPGEDTTVTCEGNRAG